MFRKSLGNCLQRNRIQKAITQQKLAQITGLNRSYISALEKGIANITVCTLNKLAIGLRVEIMLLVVENRHRPDYEEERL